MDLWLGTPLLQVLARLHRRRRPPAEIRRLGVICSPALGDTLLFSGVLQDLRAAFPAAEIVHVCMPTNLAAAEVIPGADRRLVISLTDPAATVRLLRAERFDALLDFTAWQRLTALYTLLAGARYTVGFQTAGMHRSRGYDCTVEHRADRHETGNFRALILGSGLLREPREAHAPTLSVNPPEHPPFTTESDLVVFHLWASGQRSWLREWPEEHWIALAQKLERENTLFVITGAPSDAERSTPFVERMRAAGLRTESFVSPDGFRTLVDVLRRARIVVSVNTGVMHLAAVAGARTVAINGPNRNGRWGPMGPHAIGVEAPGEGCGYLHLGFDFDGRATDCMERTTVDQVYAACEQLMREDAR